jgi:uncharacterized membrane protein YeaQ/YmgE (transglycosylase-associated protein family)
MQHYMLISYSFSNNKRKHQGYIYNILCGNTGTFMNYYIVLLLMIYLRYSEFKSSYNVINASLILKPKQGWLRCLGQ